MKISVYTSNRIVIHCFPIKENWEILTSASRTLIKNLDKEILSHSQTKTLPLLKAGDVFISGTIPIIKYLVKSAKDSNDSALYT